jgi:hypothetical protein
LTDPLYSKATIIVIILIIAHEMSGYNAIMLYSNTILKDIFGDNGGKITPKVGSVIIGAANCLSSCTSLYILKVFKKRTLLWPGEFIMSVTLALVGICALYAFNDAVIIMIVVFLFFYQCMNGAVIWVYSTETVVDTGLGICIMVLWLFVLLLSLTTNYMMSSIMGTYGTFWLFGACSFVGGIFCYFFIKETYGLTDKEKK